MGLFVTCLANMMRPSVAFAAAKLLTAAGCRVEVPERQVCCGQPALNSGARGEARSIAKQVIEAFEDHQHVVGPSGSCMATLRHAYPTLFADDPVWGPRAQRLAARSWELTSFLTEVVGMTDVPAHLAATVTYHDSCSGLRELGVKRQPRELLRSVEGLRLAEIKDAEVCCGFGGAFCIKYPEISGKMADDKIGCIEASGAEVLLGGDLGCLLHLAGRLKRRGSPVRVYHVAEVLAGMADAPGIGDPGAA
ncbi:Fe-S oxidoreductase [Caldimonas brevitalea]|uniref:Fe-S oxidoreductase n=1 Tax=Caldimonas brevitalea TaxID=413882 RepID=A0A0G3BIH0_9BURK|nr:Fe-S oxidoreductase [Caldimonas brevitalea]